MKANRRNNFVSTGLSMTKLNTNSSAQMQDQTKLASDFVTKLQMKISEDSDYSDEERDESCTLGIDMTKIRRRPKDYRPDKKHQNFIFEKIQSEKI